MKTKLITKVLLITLSLITALSLFAACDEEAAQELQSYKDKVDELESNVNDNIIKIEGLETKEVVAELKALAESIKATADAAATQTALEEAITALETADSTQATAQALAEVKAALEESLKANGDADAATKTAIEEAIASVKATADAAATAAALDAVKAALEKADKAGADAAAKALSDAKSALEAAIKNNSDADAKVKAEIDAALAALTKTDTDNASAAAKALSDAVAALEASLKANGDADAAVKAEIDAAIATLTAADSTNAAAAATALAEAKAALEASLKANGDADAAAKAALEAAIADVDTKVASLTAAVAANKTAIENSLAAAVSELKTANTKVATDAAKALEDAQKALEDADNDINDAIEATNNALTGAKSALEAADDEINAAIEATNKALTEAKDALTNSINANSSDIEAVDTALKAAIEALEGADTKLAADLTTAKTELTTAYTAAIEQAKAELTTSINANTTLVSSTKKELQDKIDALDTKAATKQALNDAIGSLTALQGTVAANKTEAETNLENAIADLTTKYDKAVSDGDTELATELAAVKSGLEATLAEVKATANAAVAKTVYEAKVAELAAADTAATNALNNAKTELTNAYTAAIATAKSALEAAYKAADEDVKKAYAEADKAIETKLATLQTAHDTLSGKVTALETLLGKYTGSDLNGDGKADISNIADDIADIRNQLKALGADIIVKTNNFANGYELATRILQGIYVTDFEDDADLTAEGAMTAEQKYEAYLIANFGSVDAYENSETGYINYTFANFDALIDEVKDHADWYTGSAEALYNAFMATFDRVDFFLRRATSKETVKTLFDEFKADYDALPEPHELLDSELDSIEEGKKVTADEDVYATAAQLEKKCKELGISLDVIFEGETLTLQARFDNIKAACTNLADAIAYANGTVKPAIEAIDATIVWTNECKGEVTAARNAYDTLGTYFADTTYTALYNEESYTAELLAGSANVTKLEAAEKRVAELTRAIAMVSVFENDAYYNNALEEKPLYTKLDGITNLETAVNNWKNGNSDEAEGWGALENENVEYMLGTGIYAKITAAQNYAEAMDAVNTAHDKDDALENDIKTMNGKPLVLYTNREAVKALRTRLDALIKAVEGDTENLNAIIPADIVTSFKAVEQRTDELIALKEAIDDIASEMKSVGNDNSVAYDDYTFMNNKKDEVVSKYEAKGVVVGDDNYVAIAKPAIDKYDAWLTAYKAQSVEIKAVYDKLQIAINTGLTLKDGQTVIDTSNLSQALNVGNTNIFVDVGAESLKNYALILNQWDDVAVDFALMAKAAEEGAVAVKSAIDGIWELDATNLNNYKTIIDAYATYIAWASTTGYFNTAYDYTAEGKEAEAHKSIEDIQSVPNQLKPNGDGTFKSYVFITTEYYEKLVAQHKTAVATKEAADAAFATLSAKFDELAENVWTVYDYNKFNTAKAEWLTYVQTYYVNESDRAGYTEYLGTTITDATFGAEQKAEYDAFKAEYDKFRALLDTMVADTTDFDELMAAISATVDAGNLNNYEDIEAAFDAYVTWHKYLDKDAQTKADALTNGESVNALKNTFMNQLTQIVDYYNEEEVPEKYAFVQTAELERIFDLYAIAVDAHSAAKTEFDGIKADFAAIDVTNIHAYPEFGDAFTRYNTYLNTYYTENDEAFVAITAVSGAGIFGESAWMGEADGTTPDSVMAKYKKYHDDTLAPVSEAAAKFRKEHLTEEFYKLNANDLNNYGAIETVYNTLNTTLDTIGKEDLTALAEYKDFDGNATYAFITDIEYQHVYDVMKSESDQKTASAEAWTALAELMGKVKEKWTAFDTAKADNQWDIHSGADFEAAAEAFKNYLMSFYAVEITDGTLDDYCTSANVDVITNDVNTAKADMTNFVNQRNAFKTWKEAADEALAGINQAIVDNGLATITIENVTGEDGKVSALAAIRTAIEAYKTTYGCDESTCESCMISDENRAMLERSEVKANYYAIYQIEYKKLEDAPNDDLKTKFDLILSQVDVDILTATPDGANNTKSYKVVYNNAISRLNTALGLEEGDPGYYPTLI